jgi:hypothetical protein
VTITPIPLVNTRDLTEDETTLVGVMLRKLSNHKLGNLEKLAYYEGAQTVQQLGIAIPPNLSNVQAVVGWAGTTVDVLEERLDWYGWASEADDYGLGEVYTDNALSVDSSRAHLDALIYGTAFAVVGSGERGEPSPLVTMHSPQGVTGIYDPRTRRLRAALALTTSGIAGRIAEATLYLPDQTVYLSRDSLGGAWRVDDRDIHMLGRVPVVQFENRARNDVVGRSEITPAVRSYTDQAVRTMLAMEIHREFYQAPQRYALGVDESAFVNADGTRRTGWETIMGRVWAIARDDDGELPQVGQFTPASPTPYLDQVKGLAQLLAAEAAIPPSYLGFQTDNPASADAIQRSEARLVKRAERRQASFGRSWTEVGRLALLVRDGEVPDDFTAISAKWRDAATPTRSAAADEATKLVGSGILPADSQVTYDRIGLSPAEQRQVAADRRRAAGAGVLTQLQAAAERTTRGDTAGA